MREALGGQPAIHFDGNRQFLQLNGQILLNGNYNLLTVIAIVTDDSADGGHREIISNWRAPDRTTSSVFLGTTGDGQIRFSDQFVEAGVLDQLSPPTILTAVNSHFDATVYQNHRLLGQRKALQEFDFNAPYVIGTQGSLGGEDWHGDIAELLVYGRALSETECETVWSYLASRYSLVVREPLGNRQLALASLCHVLLSTNEFIYVD